MKELNDVPSESNEQKPFYELEDIPDSELKGEQRWDTLERKMERFTLFTT